MAKQPKWTREEEQRLLDLLDRHHTYAAIGAALGRSEGGVRQRCMKLGVNLTGSGYSQGAVARLMGVDDHAAASWCRRRWLRSYRIGRTGRGWARLVEHDDLLRFLEDERYWHTWQPDRIADEAIREWARELRGHVRFLTTVEVGERLCLTHYAVNQLIRQGRIRAVKWGNWYVREDWLQMPEYRYRPPGPRLSDKEVEFIRRYWGRKPATWIAAKIGNGRNDSTVCTVAYRLGLPRLGRGYWKRLAYEQKRTRAS